MRRWSRSRPRLVPDLIFEAIGTRWQITTAAPLAVDQKSAIHALIDRYDQAFSRFRPDSVVTRMSQQAGSFELPPEAADLFALYERLGRLTDGAISPLVGTALVHLGYDAQYSLRPQAGPPALARWEDVCRWDGERLVTTQPVVLDVGAVGKGQLVDLVSGLLRAMGMTEVTVDAGGDLSHVGPALRVGLESPFDPAQVVGVVSLDSESICGSAPNRRRWGQGLHHILDARSGVPVQGIAATWAVAGTAMVADGAATALFFCDVDRVATLLEVAAVAVRDDRSITWSSNLKGEVFS